jgi:hypothetical protein
MDGRPDAGAQEEDLLGTELRALLSSLPKELAPETDLTASIAAQTWDSREKLPGAGSIDADATDARRRPSPWWSGQGLKLAAAAAVLVVVTSAVTTAIVRDRVGVSSDADTTVAEATTTSLVGEASFTGYQDIEIEYASAISDLTEALELDRGRLPAETVVLIEENLRVIDEAIRQSLAALESAPESLPLQQAVVTSYEKKLDFLRQATALTAEG